ncbi:hypothetical protein [Actinoplanes sp. NPDC049681]|uniref:hypothetical protein n=1 Tax=Actinoplanes sp. NPDC049681 TaxID=3363905 RepID=UPI00378DA3D6
MLRNDAGQPYGIVTYLQDVRALREAQRALTQREAMSTALALRASDLALVADRAGRLCYVSPAAIATMGYEPELITLLRGFPGGSNFVGKYQSPNRRCRWSGL